MGVVSCSARAGWLPVGGMYFPVAPLPYWVIWAVLDNVSASSSGTRTSSKDPSVYIVIWPLLVTACKKSFTPWGSSTGLACVRDRPICWLHSSRLEQYRDGESMLFCCAREMRSVTTAEEAAPRCDTSWRYVHFWSWEVSLISSSPHPPRIRAVGKVFFCCCCCCWILLN